MRKTTLIPRLNLMELSCIWITSYVPFFSRNEHLSFLWRRLWSVAEKNHWAKPSSFRPFFSHGTFCTFSTFVKTVFLTIKNLKLASSSLFKFLFLSFSFVISFFPAKCKRENEQKKKEAHLCHFIKCKGLYGWKVAQTFVSLLFASFLDERNSIPSFFRPSHFSFAPQFSSSPSFDSCRLIQESTLPSLLIRPSSHTILIPHS